MRQGTFFVLALGFVLSRQGQAEDHATEAAGVSEATAQNSVVNFEQNFLDSKDFMYTNTGVSDVGCTRYEVKRSLKGRPRKVTFTCYPAACPANPPIQRIYRETKSGIFTSKNSELKFTRPNEIQISKMEFILPCNNVLNEPPPPADVQLKIPEQNCATEVEDYADTRPLACDKAAMKAEKELREKCPEKKGWSCKLDSKALPKNEYDITTSEFCTVQSKINCVPKQADYEN